MRQLRFAPRIQALNAFAFSFVLQASAFTFTLLTGVSSAHALITIESVDESRVSAVTGLRNSTTPATPGSDENTTSTPIIYGGIAGGQRGTCANPSNTSTCDNCFLDSGTGVGGGDNNALACNNRRIHNNLELRLTVKSDNVENGIPMMTFVPASGDSTQQVLYESTGSTISKGNTAEIVVTWSELCAKMTVSSPGSISGCGIAGTDQASITVRVGLDGASGTTARNRVLDGDEFTTVQIVLRDGIRATGSGISTYSSSDGDMAISYFEIGSGDKKAYVKDKLIAPSGFPSANNTNIRWVRALYEKRDAFGTPVWDNIRPDSPHADLEVSGSTTTAIELTPRRITGLDNEQIYDFKLAMVDEARNVGYYTPAADNENCEDEASRSPSGIGTGSGLLECHTARPTEVVGALADTMNCFVATASYGSPMAKEVVTFRSFRDRFLMSNKAGRLFVKNYYEYGPIAAKFIAQNETLRAAGRATLWAPLQFVKFSLAHGFAAAFVLLCSIILTPPALWVGVRRMRKPRTS